MDYQARIVHVATESLRESDVRLVANSEELIQAATRVIAHSGPCVPMFARADNTILVGGEWWHAYRDLGYDAVPVIYVDQLSDARACAFNLALRRIGQMAVFDETVLASQFNIILATPDLIRMTPYSMAQVDRHLAAAALLAAIPDHEDAEPVVAQTALSRLGDVWQFDDGSRLLHGDSCEPDQVAKLFGPFVADFVVVDPPYGIAISDVSSQHAEFVQGSDVSEAEIYGLLLRFLQAMVPHLRDGCMVDTFMDHRRLFVLQKALREVGLEQKSHCVWDKEVAGMGAPFRNVAEHIIISKFGTAPHIDNIQLGAHGRNRTTIWREQGYAGFGRDRADALSRHPTSKPVSLIVEAILDFSHVGGIVYDAFIGSGTTLIAANRAQRRCFGIELDGRFVDTAVRRMEAHTGKPARHAECGLTFTELAEQRKHHTALSHPQTRVRQRGGGGLPVVARLAWVRRHARSRRGGRVMVDEPSPKRGRIPPEGWRFKKGQSGNPKGRPAKAPPAAQQPESASVIDIFKRIGHTKVSFKTGDGVSREIPYREALCNQVASACLDDPRLGFRMLQLFMGLDAAVPPRAERDLGDELLDDPIVQRELERAMRKRLRQQGDDRAADDLIKEQFGPPEDAEAPDGDGNAAENDLDEG